MQRLILPHPLWAQIVQHARDAAPQEACGLIGGRDERGEVAVAVPNVAPTPRFRYEMEHRHMVEAIIGFRKLGLDVVAVYHSHPAEAALPSQTDIAEATWPDIAYVIIGLVDAEPPDVRAWCLSRHFPAPVAVPIEIVGTEGLASRH